MKDKRPLVSVCIQTYNHVNYIKECLNSILMQETDFAYEILLGEDESTDGTREICIKYAEKYPDKIRLFLNERKNVIYIDKNPTGRYNLLNNFKQAKGKYIAICEGDDYWTDPLKLQKQVALLESHEEYSLCFTSCNIIDDTGDLVQEDKIPKEGRRNIEQEDLFKTVLPTLTVMFRRKYIANGLPPSFTTVYNADSYLFAYLLSFGKGAYLPDSTGTYRIHAGGIWSKTAQKDKFRRQIFTFRTLIENIKIDNRRAFIDFIWQRYHKLATTYLKEKDYAMLLKIYGSAFNFYITDAKVGWLFFNKLLIIKIIKKIIV